VLDALSSDLALRDPWLAMMPTAMSRGQTIPDRFRPRIAPERFRQILGGLDTSARSFVLIG
jgi:hypothetical protein